MQLFFLSSTPFAVYDRFLSYKETRMRIRFVKKDLNIAYGKFEEVRRYYTPIQWLSFSLSHTLSLFSFLGLTLSIYLSLNFDISCTMHARDSSINYVTPKWYFLRRCICYFTYGLEDDHAPNVGLTILLWLINKSLKAKPTGSYRQTLTDNGCCVKEEQEKVTVIPTHKKMSCCVLSPYMF